MCFGGGGGKTTTVYRPADPTADTSQPQYSSAKERQRRLYRKQAGYSDAASPTLGGSLGGTSTGG